MSYYVFAPQTEQQKNLEEELQEQIVAAQRKLRFLEDEYIRIRFMRITGVEEN